jgi:hypothetical protein
MPGRRARYKLVAAGSSMDVGCAFFLHAVYEQSPKQIQRRQILSGSLSVGTSVIVRKPAAAETVFSGTFGNFRSRSLISREVANTLGPEGFFPAALAPGLEVPPLSLSRSGHQFGLVRRHVGPSLPGTACLPLRAIAGVPR